MLPDQLWEDFRNGKQDALLSIYNQYIDRLYQYGRSFTSDNEIVRDTIQDLFFDLIRSHQNLGPTDNILFYLMRSFRRKLTLNLKKNHQSRYLNINEIPLQITYSAEVDIIDKESLSYQEQQVQICLKELSPKQREILYYRFQCNFEYEEICELMSLKYDSARKLVFRSLQALKKKLVDVKVFQLIFISFQN
jgi:RNA polymerase sigma factor (sigma-70 family)